MMQRCMPGRITGTAAGVYRGRGEPWAGVVVGVEFAAVGGVDVAAGGVRLRRSSGAEMNNGCTFGIVH